jgi:hypothetical protein
MRKLLILASLVFWYLSLNGQMLNPEQMRTDLDIFRRALELKHPEMYRYISKDKYDNLCDSIKATLTGTLSVRDFYTRVSPLVASLRCGHVKWLIPGKDMYYPFYDTYLFPLKLYFIDQKVYVIGSWRGNNAGIECELLSIDGRSINDIRERLLQNLTFADGYTIEGKYYELNNFFPGIFSTYYGTEPGYEIKVKRDNAVSSFYIRGISLDSIRKYSKEPEKEPFSMEITGSLAWMDIDRFFSMPNEPDFKKFLKSSFNKIKLAGIENLVIDLRGNEGGNENLGIELYKYLAAGPFKYYDRITVKKKSNSDINFSIPLLFRLAGVFKRKGDDVNYFTLSKGTRIQKPYRSAYHGTTYLLIDGQSYSVATEFASRSKSDGRVKIIGTESGGGYALNTSGFFTIVHLPNSKIDLGIPLMGFHMANLNKNNPFDRGVIPDYHVKPGPEDIVSGKDVVREYTLNLVNRSSKTAKQ